MSIIDTLILFTPFSLPFKPSMYIFFCTVVCQVGLVVSVSTSHMVGCGFASQPGYTKDHDKNVTNCLPAYHAIL